MAHRSDAGQPGDIDPAFGSSGIVQTAPDFSAGTIAAVLRQSDGKLIAVGTIASSELVLVRYNVDGTLDATFGADGLAIRPSSATYSPSFEGKVMPVLLPDDSGTCPFGARPLYRLDRRHRLRAEELMP